MRCFKLSSVLAAAAVALVVVYYWKFSHISLRTGFGHDDLMNLYFAWRERFPEVLKANLLVPTNVTRPFGTLFYATFFHWFGLDPLPFRVFCYAVLWLNVTLTYAVVRYATGSREIGLFSIFLHCHHGNYFPLYYGSGSCYDVFAFFFFYAAFYLALWSRQGVKYLNAWQCAGVAILFLCAVNSKEAAASLPAILLVYELLYNPPQSWSWMWREGRAVLVTGCVGLLFLWSRFTGPNNLLNHPAYSPVLTLERYLQSTASYLNELTGQQHLWTPELAGTLLLGMALVALVARSRTLWFAWLLVVVGAAPVAFVIPRGVAAFYIAVVGYALFLSTMLVRTREFLMRGRSLTPAVASQVCLFALVYSLSWRWQIQTQRRIPEHLQQQALIDLTSAQFYQHPDWFRPGASLLIVNDPFREYEWASSFIALLAGGDRSRLVHTLVKLDPKPQQEQIDSYATVIGWEDGRFVEVDKRRVRAVSQ